MQKNLRLRGIAFDEMDELPALIEHAADRVLTSLEAKLGVSPKPGDGLMERVRAARRVIHETRCDPDRVADHAAAASWADEAMLAMRIASYSGRYVAERPTLDRIAETAEKLGEDVNRRMMPPLGRRRAMVRFGEPIDVVRFTADRKPRLAIRDLTAALETAVQAGIDALNQANPAPGGKAWNEFDTTG